jgi:drug/metabolite transporter (DMT)-like permease
VQVSFATGAVEGKLAMAPAVEGGGGVSPLALAMTRMLGATVVFHTMLFAQRKRGRLAWGDHARLAGLSVLGVVLNQALYLLGLRLTSPVSASLLGVTIPVFTATLAVVLRHERATARLGLGLALALAGVLWLTGVRAVDRGAVLVAANSLAYSFYVVLARRIIQRLGALVVVAWLFTWGALIFAPVGVTALASEAGAWSGKAAILVAYVVLVPTVVAYAANAWALGRSTATLVTVYIYLQPLLAAFLAWVQLGHAVTLRVVLAGAFIVAGVGVVAYVPRRKPGRPGP